MSAVIFSKHARERIYERLSMTMSEVEEMLRLRKTILLGYESGTKKIHRLFYSHRDRKHFVMVQDATNSEIITVVPYIPTGHVSTLHTVQNQNSLLRKAQKLSRRQESQKKVGEAVTFIFYYKSSRDGKLRSIKLDIDPKDHPGDDTQLENDGSLAEKLLKFGRDNCQTHEIFDDVFIQRGKNALPGRFKIKIK